MRIVAIADLQGKASDIDPSFIPHGDILLIAGDLGAWGTEQEMKDVNTWLNVLSPKYKHIVFVAGNHDLFLASQEGTGKKIFQDKLYLENELIEIEGIKIWGSPFSENNSQEVPYFRAFSDDVVCDLIPEGLDILITHGPPLGILDQLKYTGKSVGSLKLLDTVQRVKPRHHIYGHIHEAHGTTKIGETTFINAAICDEYNNMFRGNLFTKKLYFDPIIIDL